MQKKDTEKQVVEFYNANKKDPCKLLEEINSLKWMTKNRRNPIASCFAKVTPAPRKSTVPSTAASTSTVASSSALEVHGLSESSEEDVVTEIVSTKTRKKPAQDALKRKIAATNSKLLALKAVQGTGMGTEITRTSIKNLEKEKIKAENDLKRLQNCGAGMKRSRANKASKILALTLEHPQVAAKLMDLHPKPVGRRRLEESQPFLLETIVEIVNHHTAAEARRRDESLRTCRTLDDLRVELLSRGKPVSLGSSHHGPKPKI